MDPRFTIKQCSPPYSAEAGARAGSKATDSHNFYRSLGKIGDLQVLNDMKMGKIGQGLRVLSGISNSVKSGCGTIPTSIGKTVESGGAWVMEHIGIAPDVVKAVEKFNPGVANTAWGQAKHVFMRVKQGNFKMKDIPSVMEDFIHLEQLANKIFSPSSWQESRSGLPQICEASPYAIELARSVRAPKYKFLFVCQFVFTDSYAKLANHANEMAFVVKKTTRPSVKFEMEDANYYNFRTKFVTKTTFEDMSMSFLDSGGSGNLGNNVTKFINEYSKAMSPIMNIGPDGGRVMELENRGMDFSSPTYSGSHGILSNVQTHILKEIMLYHVYDYGNMVNIYHFFNPRITTITEDELDMSAGGDVSSVDINFNYDFVYVEPSIPFTDVEARIMDAQGAAQYKMYNGTTKERAMAYMPPQKPSAPGADKCGATSPTKSPGSDILGSATSSIKKALSSLF